MCVCVCVYACTQTHTFVFTHTCTIHTCVCVVREYVVHVCSFIVSVHEQCDLCHLNLMCSISDPSALSLSTFFMHVNL